MEVALMHQLEIFLKAFQQKTFFPKVTQTQMIDFFPLFRSIISALFILYNSHSTYFLQSRILNQGVWHLMLK